MQSDPDCYEENCDQKRVNRPALVGVHLLQGAVHVMGRGFLGLCVAALGSLFLVCDALVIGQF